MKTTKRPVDFQVFCQQLLAKLYACKKCRTAETYELALKQFALFLHSEALHFDDFTPPNLVNFERHLHLRGVSLNTSSFYLRNLRAVYNKSVEAGCGLQSNPFEGLYTGVAITRKRALKAGEVQALRNLALKEGSKDAFARDLFLFSFYTRGMSFIDMAKLRKTDIRNGQLTYRRSKTGRVLRIGWMKEMDELAKRYGHPQSAYLLPILDGAKNGERKQYLAVIHRVNARLRRIGEDLRFPFPLTLYVARHTWANIARSRHVELAVISQAMGHMSEKTTRIYLNEIDCADVDRANRAVIGAIC